jgi:hypothetical protein
LHYATANVTRSETSSPRWNRSGRNYARRRHLHRIINRSQDDRLEDAGKYVGGIIAEQREATRLREAIRTLNAVVETHKPTCSQCGKRWEYAACGPTHASIAAARATAEGENDGQP